MIVATVTKPINQAKLFTRSEIAEVVADLKRKRRSVNTRQNLVIFRLSTCCGLRVSEIVGLKIANVRTAGKRPHIQVPAAIAKRQRARMVPLWWDAGTLSELDAWKSERLRQEAAPGDAFVCSLSNGTWGKPISVRNAQARFKASIKCLGAERVSTLSVHCGRHSFCSHSLAGGRSLAEVRDAAGHANIATTSIYLHAVRDDDEEIGNLFNFSRRY